MVHGSLVKRIPKGYLYKYTTIVFIVQQYFFKFEIFGLDLYLLPILLLKLYKMVRNIAVPTKTSFQKPVRYCH